MSVLDYAAAFSRFIIYEVWYQVLIIFLGFTDV